jgi:hypothetical protein
MERYKLIDRGLDLYVIDSESNGIVATATFENNLWIKVNGEYQYFNSWPEWFDAIEKYFNTWVSIDQGEFLC